MAAWEIQSKGCESMARELEEENEVIDKKAAKKAEKQRKKEEKKKGKAEKNAAGPSADSAEEEDEGGGRVIVALVTILIVLLWIGILGLVIKLDVGGFGSTVLHPLLKDVPYVNRILPKTAAEKEAEAVDVQYPYATLEEAINRIKELEVELDGARNSATENSATLEQLQAEVERLREFERQQAEFEQLKTKFYEEVVFSDQAPDIEQYKVFYESIDPANAASLYKQVVKMDAYNKELSQYISTYSNMKATNAAAILEKMSDDMKLVAKILDGMDTDSRGKILGAMTPDFAAQLTKLMEPANP